MTDAETYVADLKREIERETLRYKALESALGWCDATREDAIRALTAFEMDTLPVADAPPILVALLRADIARALWAVRRAGKIANKLGLQTSKLSGALTHLKGAADSLPNELPKPKRKVP